MKQEKKSKGICLVLIIVLMFGFFGSQVLGNEEAEVTNIERVQWSGLKIFGIRILGNWRPVRARYTFWGAYYTSPSPYFRLNEDDQTIFRGLGREDDFLQALFPTLYPRENIENLLNPVDRARESLEKFDEQRSTGETMYMIGSFLDSGGQIAMWGGLIGATLTLFSSRSYRSDYYLNISKLGLLMYVLGSMGKFYGGQLAQEALGHLDDAVDYFNQAHGKMSSRSSSVFLTIKVKNNKLIPGIAFNF